ncbi:hypothetical protein H4219_004905 [Mycoemilia scoparia]|uniref:Uncharacterized protein n=1 Tax=Mycoemilia scoparia TaxID=417184 RepID=A0A9W7ZY80_9FUNG|nr:hypothetical protein H4219_004905 [Mycoemilia scoparia]
MAVTAETPAPHNLETNLQNRTFMDTVEISPTGSVEEIIDNIDQFLSKVHTASSVLPDNSNNGNNQPQSRHASGGQIDEFQGFLDMLNEPIWDTTTTTTTIDMDTDGTDEQTEPAVSYITTATTDHGELEDNIDQNALSMYAQ